MQYFTLLAFLVVFAGRAIALNISIAGMMGNLTASQFLSISDQELVSDCQTQCQAGVTAIQNCGDNDNTCLCSNDTVAAITACQQCWFTDLIHQNRESSDPRAGSTAALQAYVAACADPSVNITVSAKEIALAIPADWDGPLGVGLGTAATVITAIAAAALGTGAIFVVSTM